MESFPPAFDTAAFMGWLALRSALICILALAVFATMARRSASERYVVLAVALCAILLLPAAWPGAARFSIPVETPALPMPREVFVWEETIDQPADAVMQSAATIREQGGSVVGWLTAIILSGMAVQGLLTAAGWREITRLLRTGQRFDLPRGMALGLKRLPVILLVPGARTPFVCGALRPVIVLPQAAASWERERLEMVLCHEAAHLRRGDHWMQPACALCRILYWWQPCAWLLLALLRKERERACDDRVLERYRATDYATLLVRTAREAGRRMSAALPMATGTGIGPRVQAALERSQSRRPAGRRLVWSAGLAGLTLAAGLCALRPVAASDEDTPAKNTAEESPGPGGEIEIHGTLVEFSKRMTPDIRSKLNALLDGEAGIPREIFEETLRALQLAKGVDLLSTPPLVTKDGKPTRLAVVREFKFGVEFAPDAEGVQKPSKFDSRNLGIEIEVTPTTTDSGILLSGVARMTEYAGATKGAHGVEMPVFDIKEARFLRSVGDDRLAGIRLWTREDEQMVTEMLADGKQVQRRESVRRDLAIFFSARPVADAVADAQSDAPPAPDRTPLPFGTPVEGRPGFLTSPYAPHDGDVDVRGFPGTTEVKCPFTGKVFLVP